jgi:hypothetical protein
LTGKGYIPAEVNYGWNHLTYNSQYMAGGLLPTNWQRTISPKMLDPEEDCSDGSYYGCFESFTGYQGTCGKIGDRDTSLKPL